jgi:hypothetical protein
MDLCGFNSDFSVWRLQIGFAEWQITERILGGISESGSALNFSLVWHAFFNAILSPRLVQGARSGHRCVERSNDTEPLPLRQFCQDYIIAMRGYEFLKGQQTFALLVLHLD